MWFYCCVAVQHCDGHQRRARRRLAELGRLLLEVFKVQEPSRQQQWGYSRRHDAFWVRANARYERELDESDLQDDPETDDEPRDSEVRRRFLYDLSSILASFPMTSMADQWEQGILQPELGEADRGVLRDISGHHEITKWPWKGVVLVGGGARTGDDRGLTWIGVRPQKRWARLTKRQALTRLRHPPTRVQPLLPANGPIPRWFRAPTPSQLATLAPALQDFVRDHHDGQNPGATVILWDVHTREDVIPTLRAQVKDAVLVVGTQDYDQIEDEIYDLLPTNCVRTILVAGREQLAELFARYPALIDLSTFPDLTFAGEVAADDDLAYAFPSIGDILERADGLIAMALPEYRANGASGATTAAEDVIRKWFGTRHLTQTERDRAHREMSPDVSAGIMRYVVAPLLLEQLPPVPDAVTIRDAERDATNIITAAAHAERWSGAYAQAYRLLSQPGLLVRLAGIPTDDTREYLKDIARRCDSHLVVVGGSAPHDARAWEDVRRELRECSRVDVTVIATANQSDAGVVTHALTTESIRWNPLLRALSALVRVELPDLDVVAARLYAARAAIGDAVALVRSRYAPRLWGMSDVYGWTAEQASGRREAALQLPEDTIRTLQLVVALAAIQDQPAELEGIPEWLLVDVAERLPAPIARRAMTLRRDALTAAGWLSVSALDGRTYVRMATYASIFPTLFSGGRGDCFFDDVVDALLATDTPPDAHDYMWRLLSNLSLRYVELPDFLTGDEPQRLREQYLERLRTRRVTLIRSLARVTRVDESDPPLTSAQQELVRLVAAEYAVNRLPASYEERADTLAHLLGDNAAAKRILAAWRKLRDAVAPADRELVDTGLVEGLTFYRLSAPALVTRLATAPSLNREGHGFDAWISALTAETCLERLCARGEVLQELVIEFRSASSDLPS